MKRNIFRLLLSAVLLMCCTVMANAAIEPSEPQTDGNGNYELSTAAELYWFANYVNSGNTSANAILTADITVNMGVLDSNGNLNSGTFELWDPIGTSVNAFAGEFNGDGYTTADFMLITPKRQDLFLDAGYESKDDIVRKKGMNPIICEKGHRNNHLTDEQKQNNRIKSKDRCRIEHIFGFIEGAMVGSLVRSIGMVRAKAANALTNLVYNIFRYVQIVNFHPQFITCKG